MKTYQHRLFSILVLALISLLLHTTSAQNERWVCQDCDPLWDSYSTITAAIAAAQPGDVINIHAEEWPLGSDEIIQYDEHVVINKTLIITSPEPHNEFGWPVIMLSDFNTFDEVIEVTSNAGDSEISNLDIRGPAQVNSGCDPNYPIECMDDKVGIRIEGEDCLIDNCRVTHCMTGIYCQSIGNGNIISNCQIGDRWWTEDSPGSYSYEEFWTTLPPNEFHPGNGFGIVIVEPTWTQQSNEPYLDRSTDEIVDCVIRSNKWYGIVLTNGARTHVAHNIIAWNGSYIGQVSPGVPDKTGGVLSLFTASQISANDNKIQAPTILSNSIYGNKGYQIGVFTESDDCRHIFNSPIIMSNNIGNAPDMPGSQEPVTAFTDYEYLICCGPTPIATNTPTPTATSNPPVGTTCPSFTPHPPGDFNYNYHGSGPVLAWNNMCDPSGMNLVIYHPMQKNMKPRRLTPTPTPTVTPTDQVATSTPTLKPTNTPTPTPTDFPITTTPTEIPYFTPTPIPPTVTPSATPYPQKYDSGSPSWRIGSILATPKHKGWQNDTSRVPPDYYDWHLEDADPSDPNKNPSECFNKGGIVLNPGSTQNNMFRDEGFVDLGYHRKRAVPIVKEFSAIREIDYTLSWTAPDYWPDGSIFSLSDIGGYVILIGKKPQSGSFSNPTLYGNPIYEPATSTSKNICIREVHREATHFAIFIYDTNGNESVYEWIEIP